MPPQPLCEKHVLNFLTEKIALARSESVLAMEEIDSESENLRNTMYRMAFANVLLSDALRELLRRVGEMPGPNGLEEKPPVPRIIGLTTAP